MCFLNILFLAVGKIKFCPTTKSAILCCEHFNVRGKVQPSSSKALQSVDKQRWKPSLPLQVRVRCWVPSFYFVWVCYFREDTGCRVPAEHFCFSLLCSQMWQYWHRQDIARRNSLFQDAVHELFRTLCGFGWRSTQYMHSSLMLHKALHAVVRTFVMSGSREKPLCHTSDPTFTSVHLEELMPK